MPSLRVMAFNRRLLPKIAESGSFDPAKLLSGETLDRAGRVCAAINADPWPDVIAFEEVWSDAQAAPARDAIITGLVGNYPHITPQLPHTIDVTAGRFIDSGLMLLSRHPFIALEKELPTDWKTPDDRVGFARFGDSANDDTMASKGVGVARIETPLGVFTIAFTHLQAAYADLLQYAAVRSRQLDVVDGLLRAATGPTPGVWRDDVIVMGDFNVAAIAGATEYAAALRDPARIYGSNLKDAWASWMPGTDPGITQDAWDKDEHDRLDYVFVSAVPRKNVSALVAQHMRTVHREFSDHFALRADLNRWAEHNTPAGAFVAVARGTRPIDQPPFEDNLHDTQQMRWLSFQQPGTYTLVSNEPIGVEVYDARNISDLLPRYRTGRVDLSLIPGTEVVWRDRDVAVTGPTFALRGPSYVRAYVRDETLPTPVPCRVGWHRHGGTSSQDAISLSPQAPLLETDFKVGERLNERDEQWYSCWIGRALSGLPHTSVFRVSNTTGRSVHVSVRDSRGYELLSERTVGQGESEIDLLDAGERMAFLVVRRSAPEQENVHVGWRTALTFVVPPFRLRCDDETGPDWLGADEITVQVSVDGLDIGTDSWNDADIGESFNPRLTTAAGFSEQLDVYVTEHDNTGDDHGHGHIDWLPADQAAGRGEVGISVASGHYTFRCGLLRALPGT